MIPVLLAIAAFIELAGSVCLITGYQIRIAAFVMFLYTTVVTVLFHNYWAASAAMAGIQETHFRKHLAIMGGLLMVAFTAIRKTVISPFLPSGWPCPAPIFPRRYTQPL